MQGRGPFVENTSHGKMLLFPIIKQFSDCRDNTNIHKATKIHFDIQINKHVLHLTYSDQLYCVKFPN